MMCWQNSRAMREPPPGSHVQDKWPSWDEGLLWCPRSLWRSAQSSLFLSHTLSLGILVKSTWIKHMHPRIQEKTFVSSHSIITDPLLFCLAFKQSSMYGWLHLVRKWSTFLTWQKWERSINLTKKEHPSDLFFTFFLAWIPWGILKCLFTSK